MGSTSAGDVGDLDRLLTPFVDPLPVPPRRGIDEPTLMAS
jgi:hypothetical protein